MTSFCTTLSPLIASAFWAVVLFFLFLFGLAHSSGAIVVPVLIIAVLYIGAPTLAIVAPVVFSALGAAVAATRARRLAMNGIAPAARPIAALFCVPCVRAFNAAIASSSSFFACAALGLVLQGVLCVFAYMWVGADAAARGAASPICTTLAVALGFNALGMVLAGAAARAAGRMPLLGNEAGSGAGGAGAEQGESDTAALTMAHEGTLEMPRPP